MSRNQYLAPTGIYIAVLIFSAGCSAAHQNQSAADSHHKDGATMTENNSTNQRLRELAEQSRSDLASRLNINVTDITVIEARYVIWPDGSTGCARPGYEYTQMLTEGVLIRLDANNRTFQYHSARGGAAFLCEKPSALEPPSRYEES